VARALRLEESPEQVPAQGKKEHKGCVQNRPPGDPKHDGRGRPETDRRQATPGVSDLFGEEVYDDPREETEQRRGQSGAEIRPAKQAQRKPHEILPQEGMFPIPGEIPLQILQARHRIDDFVVVEALCFQIEEEVAKRVGKGN